MEHLFSSYPRLVMQQESGRLELLHELMLNVSTEELLSAERAFTYADLYAMLKTQNTIALLTPHSAVVPAHGIVLRQYTNYRFTFTADGKVIVALASSPEYLLEICDVVIRLLAASVVHSIKLSNQKNLVDAISINAPRLAYLMEQCQSLKVLSLVDIDMDESHCRVLDSYSKPGLKIVLEYCRFTSAGASALAEVLGRNQGPTKLHFCGIDNSVVANGLRGNSRLKSLKLSISSSPEDGNRELLAIAGVLRENKGLVDLDLSSRIRVSDETFGAICDSLEAHPTIEALDLRASYRDTTTAPALLKIRMQPLLDMVKINMSIHAIHLDCRQIKHTLFRETIIPYLETNRFRPRVRAIQKTRPIMYRVKVLGRALLAARTDPNRFWMLLSGNAEVLFPASTTTIAAGASPPMPASTTAAAATSTADVAGGRGNTV
jgi:hypothetical protein